MIKRSKFFSLHALILIIIVFLSIYLVWHLFSISCLARGEWCGQDMDQYMDYSTNLLSGHGFTATRVSNMYYISPQEHIYIPEILRVPVFPVLIALGRIIYNNAKLIFIINLISFLGILGYSYLLMKIFLSKTATLLGMLLLALSPTVLFYTGFMGNVDIFVTFVTIGFLYHLLSLRQGNNNFHLIMMVIYGLGTVLSRQNTMVMVLLPLVFFGSYSYFKKEERIFINIIAVLILVLLGILGWSVRNFNFTGKFTFSAASGDQLFTEHVLFTPFPTKESITLNKEIVGSQYGEKYMRIKRQEGVSVPRAYVQIDSYLSKVSWNYILRHPQESVFQFLLAEKSIFTQRTYNWEQKDLFASITISDLYVGWILLVMCLCFPFIGLVKMSQNYVSLIFLWISAMLFISISAFYHGVVIGNRGLMPVLPLVIVLSLSLFEGIIKAIAKLKLLSYEK